LTKNLPLTKMPTEMSLATNMIALSSSTAKFLVLGLLHLAIFLINMWWVEDEEKVKHTVPGQIIPLLSSLLRDSPGTGERQNTDLRDLLVRELSRVLTQNEL
jgi:hypothetical protein